MPTDAKEPETVDAAAQAKAQEDAAWWQRLRAGRQATGDWRLDACAKFAAIQERQLARLAKLEGR